MPRKLLARRSLRHQKFSTRLQGNCSRSLAWSAASIQLKVMILSFSIVITSSWTPRTPQRKYPHHLGEELNSDKFSPSHVSYLVGGLKSIHLVILFVFVFLLLHTLNRDWPTEDRDWFFYPRRPKCPAFYRKVIWKWFLMVLNQTSKPVLSPSDEQRNHNSQCAHLI